MLPSPSYIADLEQETLIKIQAAMSLDEVEALRIALLGKKGLLTEQFKKLGNVTAQERSNFGAVLNKAKSNITEAIAEKTTYLSQLAQQAKLAAEAVDVTLPVNSSAINEGCIHPLSSVMDEAIKIFAKYGFVVASGNDIETDYYNFEALNFPTDHPARQMHDTFFLEAKDETGKAKLLRTHTSPVQIHAMRSTRPPLRIIACGKTYRMDEDATHSPMFHQLEGLFIDKNANIAQLKWILQEFCKSFFNSAALKMRFRPSFFPFTQPSMEVDINCCYVGGELQIGRGDKWLEILGCGMVHPNVLQAGHIDSNLYQGFAWGVGIERLAMLKYSIKDLRSFFGADINWIKHYGFKSFNLLVN